MLVIDLVFYSVAIIAVIKVIQGHFFCLSWHLGGIGMEWQTIVILDAAKLITTIYL